MSSLSQYLQEIGSTVLLTAEEEQALAKRIQKKNDPEARELMMRANLRLVVSIAKKYSPANDQEAMLDLIQEGNLGLMRAVDRYQPDRGTRFSTYGVYWIKQAILRALKRRRLLRLPENVVDQVYSLQKTKQKLYQLLGRAPEPEELAKEMDLPLKKVRNLEGLSNDVISLEVSVKGSDEGDETQLKDLLEDVDALQPDAEVTGQQVKKAIQGSVEALPGRERKILEMRFGLVNDHPKTLGEIGEEFGISRERVRQLQNTALSRLKERKSVQRAHTS